MKNKVMFFVMMICLVFPCALLLSACGHEHVLTKVDATLATCETDGNSEYYKCGCGKYFSDAEGINTIEKDSWIIDAKGHNFNQKVQTELYYKSDADCEHASQYYYSCECGERGTETFEVGQPLGHEYKIESRYNPGVVFQNLEEDNFLEEDDKLYVICLREDCHFHTTEDNVLYSWETGASGEIYRKWQLSNGDFITEEPVEFWDVVAYTYAVNNSEINLVSRFGGDLIYGLDDSFTLSQGRAKNDISVTDEGEFSILFNNFRIDSGIPTISKIYINRGNVKVSYNLTESFEDGLYRYDADANIFYIKYNPQALGNIMLSFEIEE